MFVRSSVRQRRTQVWTAEMQKIWLWALVACGLLTVLIVLPTFGLALKSQNHVRIDATAPAPPPNGKPALAPQTPSGAALPPGWTLDPPSAPESKVVFGNGRVTSLREAQDELRGKEAARLSPEGIQAVTEFNRQQSEKVAAQRMISETVRDELRREELLRSE